MSVSVEKLENSMAKLTIEVSAEDFSKALNKVYNKEKGRISINGFRKGKAPRKAVERVYGAGVFYEDAANECINNTYTAAAKESGEDIVSNPSIEVTQIEEGKPLVYVAEVALRPPVTLGQYKGVEVDKLPSDEATDDDINNELKRQQEANAKTNEITDRPVKDGDEVTLDFAGTIDGKAFEGGTASDYELKIGSHSFIDNFEDQLVGMNIGEEKDVNVTFPEDYAQKDLAGKPAVFHCTIKKIKEKILPELNDAFADEVSEFSTLEEYKQDIAKKAHERKAENNKNQKENQAIDKVIDNATIDIPAPMLSTTQENILNEYSQSMMMQGIRFDDYLNYLGMTRQQFLDEVKPQAEKRIRTRLCLEEIAKAENIEATEEDVQKEMEDLAKQYNMEIDRVKKIFEDDADQMKSLKSDIQVRKAADLVRDNAVEVEKKEEPKEEEKKDAE